MTTVEQFQIDRPCGSHFDTSQLSLQDLPHINSHYSRRMLLLPDADVMVRWSANDVKSFFPDAPADATQTGMEVRYSFALLFRYRMDWVPKGFGLGELVSSHSLLPNEELTLEFKTWETDKRQENTSLDVDGRQTSDVATTNSDVREVLDDFNSKEDFEFDAHADASWGFGSASANTKFSTESAKQHKTVTKASRDSTQKSSNELTQKRSVKVAVSRETGSEDKSTRKIKNINQCRTLNINYYQLLRQYEVEMHLYDVSLIMLGAEIGASAADLGPIDHFDPPPGGATEPPVQATAGGASELQTAASEMPDIGGILALIRSGALANQTVVGTIFPRIVRRPPTGPAIVQSLRRYPLDKNVDRFQTTILTNCTPRPELNDPDIYWRRRYAFEVDPGFEVDEDGIEQPVGLRSLLDYLYGLYTTQSPPLEMQSLKVVTDQLKDRLTILAEPFRSEIVVPAFHVLAGASANERDQLVTQLKDNLIKQFLDARVDLKPEALIDKWPISIPTRGVYAETLLGECSGCEDFIEVSRQFDLELKQLEIKRRSLVNDRIAADAQDQSVTVLNVPPQASVKLLVGDVSDTGKVLILDDGTP